MATETPAAKQRRLKIIAANLKAAQLRLKLSIQRGESVRRDAAELGCQRLGLRIRDATLAVPLRVTPALAAKHGLPVAALNAVATRALRETLTAWADTDEDLPVRLG